MQVKDTACKRLLFFVAEDWYFMLHFLQFAVAAKKDGWKVALVCNVGQKGSWQTDKITAEGIEVFALPLERTGLTPIADLRALFCFLKIADNWQPDLIHAVAIKPILFSYFVSALKRIPLLAMITGLGYVFTSNHFKATLARPLVGQLFRMAAKSRFSKFAVLNDEDSHWLVQHFAVESAQIFVIPGTGVDMDRFKPEKINSKPFRIAYIGRMLKDKGLFELIEAARILKGRSLQFKLLLAGAPDPSNPESINTAQIMKWQEEGLCEYVGHLSDIETFLRTVHAVTLPSYREGLGMSLLEAAATGLPCIATDVPGCRSAVVNEKTGLLVPAKNAKALADAIYRLAKDPSLCAIFGRAAKKMVSEKFSQEIVVSKMINIYRSMGNKS